MSVSIDQSTFVILNTSPTPFNTIDIGELGITTGEVLITQFKHRLESFIVVQFSKGQFWYNEKTMKILGEL